MAVGSGVVKITAKTALKNNYLKVVAGCSILLLTWFCNKNISNLLSVVLGSIGALVINIILNIALVLPLALGLLRYVWRMLYSANDKPVCVFYWFSSKKLYFKGLKFILNFTFRIIMWMVIFNVPSVLLLLLSKSYIFDIFNTQMPIWAANLEYYSMFLRNVSYVLVFFMSLKFYMAPILFIADEDIDVNEAMYNSTVISKKTSFDFLGLILSLVLWILPSALLLPLPFTLPMILTSYCVHIRFSITEYNLSIEESRMENIEFI